MKELAIKVKDAPRSKIRELFDLAAGRSDVISLGIGQPDFLTPHPAIEGNIEALNKNITYYAPTRGIPKLLEQLEQKLKIVNGIETSWRDNIILTNGGSQALNLTFASIFNPGDELILSSPNFISYFYLAAFFDVKAIEVERRSNFGPDIEKMKNSITDKTKAILINSPNNPTGYSLNKRELDEIVDVVKQNDLYLISDEVYENYLYDDAQHTSPASLKDMFNRTITINAMSKLYSATGFRLGYIAANKEIIDIMEKYHQYTAAGTNHAAQYGFLRALQMDSSFFEEILVSFDERRLLAFNRLSEMGFEVVKPNGAFYIMPKIAKFGLTGAEFSNRIMKERAVAIVPGNVFGSYSDTMLRMSYATKLEKLIEAMDRIEKFISSI
ncbi:MAG TPA: aminotransferase class I/II-fold pyridoxal phosphate-dependent enzyme [Candidatus Nanopelagicaceae bacterium]|nr:aminotransferase class I/II-fold pyridoxal phosphate-dependent enzyme [Candidatus Nanopelagicaceae bacterium]